MENTEKVLFEDNSPQWYVAMGDRWVGPVTASDVYERVMSRKITWAHFVWKPGEKEWKRLCDVPMFAAAVPQQPSRNLQEEVKESSKEISTGMSGGHPVVRTATGRAGAGGAAPAADENGWFLYYNETQFGPFTKEDVVRLLNIGKVTPRVHAWRSGLATWTRIESLDSFKQAISAPRPPRSERPAPPQEHSGQHQEPRQEQRPEHRKDPRRPLVAKILLANSKEVSTAICRDISVGGMQVLTDQNPGQVGERIKLNVSAPPGTAGSPGAIEPFVAEGVIIRLLEDQKGFSFRFERLSEQAKRTIEQYISSS